MKGSSKPSHLPEKKSSFPFPHHTHRHFYLSFSKPRYVYKWKTVPGLKFIDEFALFVFWQFCKLFVWTANWNFVFCFHFTHDNHTLLIYIFEKCKVKYLKTGIKILSIRHITPSVEHINNIKLIKIINIHRPFPSNTIYMLDWKVTGPNRFLFCSILTPGNTFFYWFAIVASCHYYNSLL